jgi:hypothetical protein
MSSELDTDEALETSLRQELIEIALVNGVRDAETLVTSFSPRDRNPELCVALVCERITVTPDMQKSPEKRQLDVFEPVCHLHNR